ncbi:hypothetical protein TanjilG_08889 [Lupinus angustifolius]|uniref:Uncharacterized protein n=1 Tax=Lupinus angustifolius TaxID=3871 RepID=A0A394DB27_LUPAN|nr:hypothetical protein TanjilG_08889 [Lupinus angustifolius]
MFLNIIHIGSRIGQVGVDFGTCLNGMVQQFYKLLPMSYKQEEDDVIGSVFIGGDMGSERIGIGILSMRDYLRSLSARLKNHGFFEDDNVVVAETVDEEGGGFNFGSNGILGTRQQV